MKDRAVAEVFLKCGQCDRLHCYWCGRSVRFGMGAESGDMATREHMIPKAEGGSDSAWNLELACKRCNNARGEDQDWVSYHDHMGDEKLMSIGQRLVLARPDWLGPSGVQFEAVDKWNHLVASDPVALRVRVARPKSRACVTCGKAVTVIYPVRQCFDCFTYGDAAKQEVEK